MSHSAQTILIAGGGIAGLTLAVLLKQDLGAGVDVTVCDATVAGGVLQSSGPGSQMRVSALAHDGQRLLERLGVWGKLSSRAQPIAYMEITDSAAADPVRMQLLGLMQDQDSGEQLAQMIVNDDLVRALVATALEVGVSFTASRVERWLWGACSKTGATSNDGVARLSDGSEIRANLLIAADGAKSRLRELAGIGWYGWNYDQSAIVATIAHDRPHLGKATQHFLPSGPFAILPLTGNRSSIVWSEKTASIPALLAMDTDDILVEIGRRFGHERGEIRLETYPVGVFPLAMGIARRFYGQGLALVGDAAHLVHPIAGQGLNLGLRDVVDLGHGLAEAIRIGLPAGGQDVLRAYEKRRRPDVVAMVVATDGLNRLFSNDIRPVRLLRGLGARLVERAPGAKQGLMRYAAGGRGEVE